MIDKKINSRAKRDTCSIDRYDVIEKYIVLYRKCDTMHIKVSFDLFWEIYAGEVRACSFVSPFFSTCAHARMCVLHICINHPRARTTNIAVQNASTFIELWPGNGAAVLCLAFDNRSTRYVHMARHRRRWTNEGNAALLFAEKRLLSPSVCFAILMFPPRFSRVYSKLRFRLCKEKS